METIRAAECIHFLYAYTYVYIYIYENALLGAQISTEPQSHRSSNPNNPKTPKNQTSKTPELKTSKNPRLFTCTESWKKTGFSDFWILGVLEFWIFGICFWNVGFLDVCILDPQTCGYLDTRNCISVYRRCQGWIILPYIYIYRYICTIYVYTYVHWLDQVFSMAEGYLAPLRTGHGLCPCYMDSGHTQGSDFRVCFGFGASGFPSSATSIVCSTFVGYRSAPPSSTGRRRKHDCCMR